MVVVVVEMAVVMVLLPPCSSGDVGPRYQDDGAFEDDAAVAGGEGGGGNRRSHVSHDKPKESETQTIRRYFDHKQGMAPAWPNDSCLPLTELPLQRKPSHLLLSWVSPGMQLPYLSLTRGCTGAAVQRAMLYSHRCDLFR